MISIVDAQERRARTLAALADGTRAGIVEMLAERPRTAGEIHRAFPIAAPAVSRHLRVLREAGIVEQQRAPGDRRVHLYGLRPEPVRELAAWLDGLGTTWQSQLESFKDYVALRAQPAAKTP